MGLDLPLSLATSRRIDHPLRRMGLGFCTMIRLSSTEFCSQTRTALDFLALYSLSIDDYVSGRLMQKSLERLAEERNFVQHRILRLCPEDGEADGVVGDGIAHACHRAGLIYSYCSLFPMSAAPFALLVRQLRAQFKNAGFFDEWKEVPELLTWVAVMYGIAAVGMPERALATTLLRRCVERLMIDSWEQLKELLLRFLWFPSTNDIDGMELWDEIEQMEIKRQPIQIVEIE